MEFLCDLLSAVELDDYTQKLTDSSDTPQTLTALKGVIDSHIQEKEAAEVRE